MLTTVVEGDPTVPFSLATIPVFQAIGEHSTSRLMDRVYIYIYICVCVCVCVCV